MIVVETTLLFIPFVILMSIILIMVNIVTMQARIHYAMTQAASAVSMYDYALEAVGLADLIMNNKAKSAELESEANVMKGQINGILGALESLDFENIMTYSDETWGTAAGWVNNTVDEPKEALVQILNYSMSEASNAVFARVMRPLIGRYLSNGNMTGDEYLRSVGVTEGLDGISMYSFSLLDFSDFTRNDSVLLTEDGSVQLVCKYEVVLPRGILPFPIGSIEVTQYVKTKAWLGGRGKGYEGK